MSRPAWTPTSFEWDGGAGESVVELAPSVARAVHIAGEAAGEDIDHFFEMASSTELNALMLDLKDESGLVWYNSADPTADEVGAIRGAYDLSAVAARAEEEDLYLIGRLVVFNDPTAAVRKPDMSVDSATDQSSSVQRAVFPRPDRSERTCLRAGPRAGGMLDGGGRGPVRLHPVSRQTNGEHDFHEGVSLETRTATIIGFLEEAAGPVASNGLCRRRGCVRLHHRCRR